MARRKGISSHFERMFEEFLRAHEVLYLAVNESRRPLFRGTTIKNFDFVVSSLAGKYLIDVKGKQLRYGDRRGIRFENWIRKADISGLVEWSLHFTGFKPLLVFPYLITANDEKERFQDIRSFAGSEYGIVAIELAEYYRRAKPRAAKWDAISVSGETFEKLAKPISEFIPELKRAW